MEMIGEGIALFCKPSRPCNVAFFSHNPVTLICPNISSNASVSWQYINFFDAENTAKTFIGDKGIIIDQTGRVSDLQSKSTLQNGNLRIHSPTVNHSGIYSCMDGEKIMAYYEVDIQDVHKLYVSHADVGQTTLQNTSVNTESGIEVTVFTVWSKWQPCDRCGSQGERKRLGFCYGLANKLAKGEHEPLPCGLLFLRMGKEFTKRGPEMQLQTCSMPCSEKMYPVENETETHFLLLDSFLIQPLTKVSLICPGSSIYREPITLSIKLAMPWKVRRPFRELVLKKAKKCRPEVSAAPPILDVSIEADVGPETCSLEGCDPSMGTIVEVAKDLANTSWSGNADICNRFIVLFSLISPVYWKKDSTPYTYLTLFEENGTRSLDITDGGSTLFVVIIDAADAGDYMCYVNNRLRGRFHLELGNKPHETEVDVADNTDHTIEKLLIVLCVVIFLAILLSTLKIFKRFFRCIPVNEETQ
ncbi:protein FAM187B [Protopterus annectens]|uniref:protein FAM187B n=1 Tax=Protopterus annectens TaxID=7888 RepID=UPI001CFAFF19|nr:protein FAM187B [Protopterus annectens]